MELECFVFIMLLVAFFILSERKFLGYIQLRKGPNKVGLVGLFQRFADFFKLVTKFNVKGYALRSWVGGLGVILIFFRVLVVCLLYRMSYTALDYPLWLLYFLAVFSRVRYSVLLLATGSGCKYSLIGGIRMAFVSVSFEAVFMCILLAMGELYGSYKYQGRGLLFFIMPVYYIFWWVMLLSESKRTPSDFGEAEREIVSGIHTEYGGFPFLVVFACEYLNIYVLSWFTASVFFSNASVMVLLHVLFFV